MDPSDEAHVIGEVFGLLGRGTQVAPYSARYPAFDLASAYRIAAAVRLLREARGEHVVGRKIGFTNRTIWDEYGVHHPIWGYIYNRTVLGIERLHGPFPLQGMPEPRIEPEIVFGLARSPSPAMDEAALLDCIDWVAHGFEIVQSIYPGWKFAAADTVAAYGLHGALLIGPPYPVAADRAGWLHSLSRFLVELDCDDARIDTGDAANVLDGPLSALRHLVLTIEADPTKPRLAGGEIVTTGTLTRAFPVRSGQVWSTRLHGIGLSGLRVAFG